MINPFKKPLLFSCIYFWLALFLVVSCQSGEKKQPADAGEAKQLQFKNYANLKPGFTTQNFQKAMPVSVENTKKLIDYAADQGFAWLELRDSDAVLSLDESKEIADHARNRGIEVIYAIQKGLLDEDFWPTFERGVRNAAVFEGPGIIRSLTGNSEFTKDENKTGWSQEELERIVLYADSAAGIAENNDLQYVIENGLESFFGKGNQHYGAADVLSRVSENVGWQFDTANPFSVSRSHASPDSIIAYLEEYGDKLHYIHLKSAREGEALSTLTNNPLAFGEVFRIMAEHDVPYVAIELQAPETEDQVYENMKQSIEYLKAQDLIQNP